MTLTPMSPRPRGFALPGHAAAAARKGHQLGKPYCREWTPQQARKAASKATLDRMFVADYRKAMVPA